jgi:hypothetical protein
MSFEMFLVNNLRGQERWDPTDLPISVGLALADSFSQPDVDGMARFKAFLSCHPDKFRIIDTPGTTRWEFSIICHDIDQPMVGSEQCPQMLPAVGVSSPSVSGADREAPSQHAGSAQVARAVAEKLPPENRTVPREVRRRTHL